MTVTISDGLIRSIAPVRNIGAHKWGVGGLLVIAGSPQYPGAAWLASRSAGRNGAGIVCLATPRRVVQTMASAMPEVAFLPLPDTDAAGSARRAVEVIADVLPRVRAVVIGPGLGSDASAHQLLSALFGLGAHSGRQLAGFGFGAEPQPSTGGQSIFERATGSIVMDADGLNWLASQPEWWRLVPPNRLVLTPHPGEAHRLSGLSVEEITSNPLTIANQLSRYWQQTVVIKSGFTAASDGNRAVVADMAPTSLATAGSGDCFAGAIGAFLAQGCDPIDAATLAIGLGSRAASALEESFGITGVLASDLPDMMATVLNRIVSATE